MVKISFLVTYYNQQQYVKDSLGSIFALDIPCDFEILVGDDGSDDNTLIEVAKYQEKFPDKISIYQMPRSLGKNYNIIHRASANRINLVKHATGDYVCFLDGDDFYVSKDYIKIALDNFAHYNNIIGAAFNFRYIFQDKERDFTNIPNNGILESKQYVLKYYTPSGAILFKNIFDSEKIKILEKCKNFDDNLITIYMSQFGNFYFNNKIIYGYRQLQNSTWNSYTNAEQNLLNALDFEIISKVAPNMKKFLFKRQYKSIKFLWKNRNRLEELLSKEKIDFYIKGNEICQESLIQDIINWKNLSTTQKIKLFILYLKSYLL